MSSFLPLPALLTLVVASTVLPASATSQESGLPPGVVRDPAAARFSYADVDRFASLLSELARSGDAAALLDSAYLGRGTIGLDTYARVYDVDGASIDSARHRDPPRYVLAATLGPRVTRKMESRIRAAMEELARRYPAALFPTTYYLVGPMRAGGAVQREGLLISVETYASGDVAREAEASLERLTHLVAHELVHYQQAAWDPELYQASNTLLARAIREGTADFVAELLTGAHINPGAHAYGRAHECALWREFRGRMDGTDTGDWFFRTVPDRPADLGYFVGYRIAAARFARAPDPERGLLALLRVADPQAFLAESGYSGGPGCP